MVGIVTPEAAGKNEPAHGCDLLWLAGSLDADVVQRILSAHQKCAVVLISERPGFAADGGGVQLFVAENGVKFEVAAEALKQQGVRVAPQLLKLSRKGPGR